MHDYKPNSHRFKAEQAAAESEKKKIQKVVNGPVKLKKKSEMSKVKDIFIAEDVSNVKTYIFMDVLVPAIKKAVSDIIVNGIDMILYGGKGGSRQSRGTNASYVSYRQYSDRRDDSRPTSRRTVFDYDEIVLGSRGEAEEVIDRLGELIDAYGTASVNDLYDLVGVTNDNYMNSKYGWINIRNAEVIRERDGYRLRLPKALPID